MSSDDEPRLPPELEREIFQTTALLHSAPPLLRVARRVLIWVEPLLYRVLIIGGSIGIAQLNAASSKPPAFLARAVRCLKIAAHPVFRCLTHLDFFDTMDGPLMALLPCLPRLTHLAFGHPGPLDRNSKQVEHILRNCRSLHILLVLYYDRSDRLVDSDVRRAAIGEVPESLRDPRLVLCSISTIYELWCEGISDGPNYWTVAEDFIARKRRREIDANNFWAD
ncbi:hypothetical protein C8F01DRAFT_1193550 [Mycena amicta]|nr:hypothetical protein C8F01DRAFT_1193550 [Mycena amicta]